MTGRGLRVAQESSMVKQNKTIFAFEEGKKPEPMECRLSAEAIRYSSIDIPERKELFDLV